MAGLRKMLGALDDPSVVELMRLMETQSRQTLAAWAAAQAEARLLPYLADCGDERPSQAVAAARACAAGERPLKEIKPLLTAARTASRELTATPVIQAAARGVGTACAVLLTPTNALGWVFYAAAAYAFAAAGTDSTREEQDRLAAEELERILDTLRACAVADEKDPVKLDWGC